MSGFRFSIIYWSSANTRSKILCPLSRTKFPLKLWLNVKNREICDINGTVFFELWEYVWSSDLSASIYDRKVAARRFDTIHDILRSFSHAISSSRPKCASGTNAYETVGNRRVKRSAICFKFEIFTLLPDFRPTAVCQCLKTERATSPTNFSKTSRIKKDFLSISN